MEGAGEGYQKLKNPSFYELNSSKSNDQIFKNLTFLKTKDLTTSNKKITPTPLWGELGEGSKMSPTIDHLGLLQRPRRRSDNVGYTLSI